MTLVKWDAFSRELERARTLPEVKNLADKARAIEIYCLNAKKGLPVTNTAIMWWLRSAKRAGEMLAGIERGRGTIAGRGRPIDRSFRRRTIYQETLKKIGLGSSPRAMSEHVQVPAKTRPI